MRRTRLVDLGASSQIISPRGTTMVQAGTGRSDASQAACTEFAPSCSHTPGVTDNWLISAITCSVARLATASRACPQD